MFFPCLEKPAYLEVGMVSDLGQRFSNSVPWYPVKGLQVCKRSLEHSS